MAENTKPKTDEELEAEAIKAENSGNTPESSGDDKFDPKKLRSIFDIISDLSKMDSGDNRKKYVKSRKQGNKDVFYIPHYLVTKILDYYASGWTYRIDSIENIGGQLIMVVSIGIKCVEAGDDVFIWRSASGNETEDDDAFGGATAKAESMAIRRAASKFGLGRNLYNEK